MSKRAVSCLYFAMLVMILAGCTGGGQSASPAGTTLMWDAPLTNTDGSPAANLGYKVYYGSVSGAYTASIDVGSATSCPVTTLSSKVPLPGLYYVAVTAYDTAGNESVYSNEISLNLSGSQ